MCGIEHKQTGVLNSVSIFASIFSFYHLDFSKEEKKKKKTIAVQICSLKENVCYAYVWKGLFQKLEKE